MGKQDFSNIKITRAADVFGVSDAPTVEQTPHNIGVMLPLSELHTFSQHMYRVREDEEMDELVADIRRNGVIFPGLVRPRPEGGYEILSGHRRRRACERAGLTEMPMYIRDFDDDDAMLQVVSTNRQRTNVAYSEKAWAYRRERDAMKRKAGRPSKGNGDQVGPNLTGKRSTEILAEQSADSNSQIKRYIRLTYLIEPLMKMVDGEDERGDTMSFGVGVNVSYLKESEQRALHLVMQASFLSPSIKQSQELKELSERGELTDERMLEIMQNNPTQEPRIIFARKDIKKYFPPSTTRENMQKITVRLMENFERRWKRENAKDDGNLDALIEKLLSE